MAPTPLRSILGAGTLAIADVTGPASPPGYSRTTGIQFNMPGLRQVQSAISTPGSNSSAYFAAVDIPPGTVGNQLTMHIYSGSSEVANGVDLSQATFHVWGSGS